MINKLFSLISVIFLIGIISGSTYYSTIPTACPSSDGTNFPGQNCAPQDICGDIGGIAQCYDTSTISPPGSSSTTTGTGGTDYSCTDTACSGGFITNCYATTNCLTALCDRNPTCYSKHTQTTCTSGSWVTSSCSATCTTNYFACDGDTTDGDGCEIQVTSCNSGHGNIVLNQCYSSTAGNCTSSTYLDCDNSDSDSDPRTCNAGNGCEILIGGVCSVGSLSGTYGSTCTGSSGTCLLTPQHFITSTLAQYQSNATNPFLWGVDYNLGDLINLSWSVGGGFYVNSSGAYFNGTLLGSGGVETDPSWTANQSYYVPYTSATSNVNLGGYDLTSHNLYTSYIGGTVGSLDMASDPWLLTGNLSPSVTLIDSLGSGSNRWLKLWVQNISTENIDAYSLIATNNVTADYFIGSGAFLTDLPLGDEVDPKWTANYTLYNDSWSNRTNFTYDVAYQYVTNGTINQTAYQFIVNGSFPTLATILGFGYYNSTSFDINNYYLKSNPYGYYNSTNPSPTYNSTYNTWSYNQTAPAITTILGYSYYNSTNLPASSEVLWNANYSGGYLNLINWAKAMNGTLMSQATYNTNYTTERPYWNTAYLYSTNGTFRELTNNSFTNGMNLTSGSFNVTAGNLSATGRIKLGYDSASCANMVSGEICRNSTGLWSKG